MTKKTRYFMAASAGIVVVGLGTGLVAYYGGGFPSLAASRSGPSELSYVPADATVVAYANVREVMDSDLRQKMKAALPNETGQREFAAETGIDIEHDIDYVVAAMTTPGAAGLQQQPNGLVVARGRFNTTQLESLVREHGGVVEEYKGKRLVKATNVDHTAVNVAPDGTTVGKPPHTIVLAFLEPGLVGIGSEDAIKSSIDAQLSARSITSNNDMMELVADIDNGNNAWAVGRFDAIQSQVHLSPEIASKIPSIKTFAVMTHIDGGLSGMLRAETRDDQSAENLRQVVQGLLALGRMQSDPKATAMINSLQLSGTGKTVALSFAVPSDVFDALAKFPHDGSALHQLPKQLHELHGEALHALEAPKPPTPNR
ncbi:MAG TPA: hypothetical protein VGI12_08670 [Vicinamibacterales bacterium]|jgi:hypothetical protein